MVSELSRYLRSWGVLVRLVRLARLAIAVIAGLSPTAVMAASPAPLRSAILPIESASLRTEIVASFSYARQSTSAPSLQIPKDVKTLGVTPSDHAPALVLGGRLVLWQRIELGVSMPLIATRSQVGVGGPGGQNGIGVGNVSGQVKVAIATFAKHTMRLAGYVAGSAPTFAFFADQNEDLLDYGTLRTAVAFDMLFAGRLATTLDVGALFQFADQPELRTVPDPNAPKRGGTNVAAALVVGASVGFRLTPWLALVGGLQLVAGELTMDELLLFAPAQAPRAIGVVGNLGLRVRPLAGFFVEAGARLGNQLPLLGGETIALHAALGYRFALAH